ncbi:MAG: hypothetical protein C0449_07865 [Polaromonas sp.]|nr:hypothetical protein [Polaromonas sp.]
MYVGFLDRIEIELMMSFLRPNKQIAQIPDRITRSSNTATSHQLSVDCLVNLPHELHSFTKRTSEFPIGNHAPNLSPMCLRSSPIKKNF